MKTNDLVSIIIPCYNYGQYLEECVQSALNQTYLNIEIVIVNDGSTDDTKEIALMYHKQYPKKVIFINQEKQGVSKARNNGIAQSKGIYILPFDADDIMDHNMVERCMETIKSTHTDIVYTGYRRIGIMGGSNIGKAFSENDFLFVAPHGVVAFYKRTVWENTGGYKMNMLGSYEDWEFWVNSFKHKFTFYHIPEILFSYRKKEESAWTKAYIKHEYAKSKIVMNHPELYINYHVLEAIEMIRDEEKLSDLYFYCDKNVTLSKKELKNILSDYLNKHSLEDKQIIDNDNLNIGLYNLEILKNKKSISKIYNRKNLNFIIFYAPMRYTVSHLTNCDFAWNKDNGIVEAHGTIFPFIFRSKREKPELQLVAYKRLRKHLESIPGDLEKQLKHWQKENRKMHNKMIGQSNLLEKRKDLINDKDDLLEKRKLMIDNQSGLLEKRKHLINDKDTLLEKRKDLIDTQTDKLQKQVRLIQSIENITQFSILKNPIQKYKVYKTMLAEYSKLKK